MANGVVSLRRFNRSFTQRIGVLEERFLGLDRPLGQSRLLWEIGIDGAALSELRTRLDLDSAYVSRLLRSLESDRLVETSADADDKRRRFVRLTSLGRAEWHRLDQRSEVLANDLLAPLSEHQQTLLIEALDTADRLLRVATVQFAAVDPESRAALSSMRAYFEELDGRFPEGFDPGDTLVADADKLRAPHGRFLVGFSDGDALACGGVQEIGSGIGEIKRMWVHSDWRGVGLGRRMLEALESQSRRLGHHVVRLDTNTVLTEAITMYETAGYQPIERYNDNPFAKHWFEKSLS